MKGNLLTETAALAMHVTKAYIKEGDFAVDATCGNGHDTLQLAQAAGHCGKVLAVDLQQQAIENSRTLLAGSGYQNGIFICGSFTELSDHCRAVSPNQAPSAVVFNLGYLPGGDKSVTTKAEDTKEAAAEALQLIKPGGIVTIVMYPGHEEGAREKELLLAFAASLHPGIYHTMYAALPNQKKNPPEILWITKKKSEHRQ